MVNLKAVRNKIRSITSIQKITKSMKMVSTTKFARAEQHLEELSHIYSCCSEIISAIDGQTTDELIESENADNQKFGALILLSSDKGLCGPIHSNIFRHTRDLIDKYPYIGKLPVITIGDRISTMARKLPNKSIMHFNSIGSQLSTYQDSQFIINKIFNLDDNKVDSKPNSHFQNIALPRLLLIHNIYVNRMRFDTCHQNILGPHYGSLMSSTISQNFEFEENPLETSSSSKTSKSLENLSVANFYYLLASYQFYSAMGLALCAEFSSRISCMESSTKNATQLLDKMTIIYNRTRQAAITNELMEIISGAAASDKKQ